MSELTTTKELFGLRVANGRGKRIGKVRRFVFHPVERRCIGLLVKRPDAALMFHRKDLFVPLDGFDLESGEVVLRDGFANDREAVKGLGVDWDACVIWVGMPVVAESGAKLGFVDVVAFDRATGAVDHLTIESGAADRAILGERAIPARFVRGFKRDGDPNNPGAIVVSDEVPDLPMEGGVAAAAGKATAVVAGKAKPVARKAAAKTGEVLDKGSYAVGKQLGKASGMFAAFKEEYEKAAHEK